MIPGFHAGSLLLQRQCDVIGKVAELGYRSVAVRPRAGSLDPREEHFDQQVQQIATAARQASVRLVLDADAMFMHDVADPNGPSLSATNEDEAEMAERSIRLWIDASDALGASLITLRSGHFEPDSPSPATEQSLERISHRLGKLLEAAAKRDVTLALRPCSGDAIATVAQFERLRQWLEMPDRLKLAADIGEMLLGHEFPVGDRLARNLERLGCVYLCDRRSGVRGDQRIGQGDVAVARIVSGLWRQGFSGPAIVRIDGHSPLGLTTAEEAWTLFQEMV